MPDKLKSKINLFTTDEVETGHEQLATTAADETPGEKSPRRRFTYLGWITVAAIFIYGSIMLAAMGHNWGFNFVETFAKCSQDEGNRQFSGAMLLRYMVVPALAAAVCMGALEAIRRGAIRWRLGISALLFSAYLIPVMFFGEHFDKSAITEPAILSVLALVMSFPLQYLYAELHRRTNATKIWLALLPALLVATLFQSGIRIPNIENIWWAEMLQYSVLVAFTGALAARLARATKQGAAFSSAIFVSLPLTLFNLANIGFTLVCISHLPIGNFQEISWRALVSASSITAITFAAAAAGGVAGCAWARRRAATVR